MGGARWGVRWGAGGTGGGGAPVKAAVAIERSWSCRRMILRIFSVVLGCAGRSLMVPSTGAYGGNGKVSIL